MRKDTNIFLRSCIFATILNRPMNGKAPNNIKRPQRLRLPYMKRRRNAAAWTYDHRVGVCVTIVAYLLIAIVFVGSKIVIRNSRPNNTFLVDLQVLEELAREQERLEQEVRMRQSMSDSYEQVLNRISNENAEQAENSRQALSGDVAEQVASDERAIADRMRANREFYEQGEREIADMWASKNKGDGSDEKHEDSKIAGRVTVSYSLVNPLRHSMHLEVPAYRCRRAGTVVVNITVNRNGNVIAASVDKGRSETDECMQQTAVDAARRSRFDINTSAPDRHLGTITYEFVAQ